MKKVAILTIFIAVFLMAPSAIADGIPTYQVTSGVITLNSPTGGGSWWLSGNGFTVAGSGLVGICGISTAVGQPIIPCSSQLPVIGGAMMNGIHPLSFDGLFSVKGVVPFWLNGPAQATFTEPVSFTGGLLACPSVCPANPVGLNDFFSLDGDVGLLTMVLTKVDGHYVHTSTTFAIADPAAATPEPATLHLVIAGMLGLALWKRALTNR